MELGTTYTTGLYNPMVHADDSRNEMMEPYEWTLHGRSEVDPSKSNPFEDHIHYLHSLTFYLKL